MSDATVTFYSNPRSRGRTIHWMLEEVEAPYDVKLLRFDKGEHKTPEFLALNPMGKLPTIVHRGVVVTESPAICAYLADAFPAAKLAPAVDSAERGAYYRWLFFGNGCLETAMVDKGLNRPEVERKGALGYGSFGDTINTLEQALSQGPYLLGEHFTAADVFMGSALGWGAMVGTIEPGKVFGAYLARLTERPAYKRAQEKLAELSKQLEG
ncbi:MAG: glutathione S-transferase family protein [Polyangiaceae bacterium]|nr:glutathione S-transferase family protein [Myxococcales bacterium]MCB9590646.1 glutathione S-transferase family protein [Polyangiaceae bacterium]